MPTKEIAITPIGYKDLLPEETFIPYHIELSNGRLTDAGNWRKRPGFDDGTWNLSVLSPVNHLIPHLTGYAISDNTIYKLSDDDGAASILDTRRLNGTFRRQHDIHNNMVIVVDGGDPVKIEDGKTSLLAGSPPKAKFIWRISSYLMMAGHNDTEVQYSTPGNPEGAWSGFNIQKIGGKIRFGLEQNDKIYIFTDDLIEVWSPFGTTNISFQRISGLKINKGCGADYSVVQANGTFYWFGNDGDFYALIDGREQVISGSYRRALNKLADPGSLYGFDFRKESVIRWFAPVDGKCFVHDYKLGNFTEDNYWQNGYANRMPINSYMEMNNQQYFGDYEPTGKVYNWSHEHKSDNGIPINVLRKFAIKLSETGNQCAIIKLRFRFKRGVETNNENNPLLSIRFRLDQGDFSPSVNVDMGQYEDRYPWIDCINPWDGSYLLGICREIEVEISQMDSVDFLLTNAQVTYNEFME